MGEGQQRSSKRLAEIFRDGLHNNLEVEVNRMSKKNMPIISSYHRYIQAVINYHNLKDEASVWWIISHNGESDKPYRERLISTTLGGIYREALVKKYGSLTKAINSDELPVGSRFLRSFINGKSMMREDTLEDIANILGYDSAISMIKLTLEDMISKAPLVSSGAEMRKEIPQVKFIGEL